MLSEGKKSYRLVEPALFHKYFKESHEELTGSKYCYVNDRTEEELEKEICIMFVDNEGVPEAYVAVAKGSGNIMSLLKDKDSKEKEFLSEIFYTAIQYGGSKLDCYQDEKDTLPYAYADAGFIPVCKIHFDREKVSGEWTKEAGEPDVIFMFFADPDVSYEEYRRNVLEDRYPRFHDYHYIPYVEELQAWREKNGVKDPYGFACTMRDLVQEKWKDTYSGNVNMKDAVGFVERVLKRM